MAKYEKVRPFMRCCDYWREKIPNDALVAYHMMLSEGQISKPHVVFNKASGSTLVEYMAIMPVEWVHDRIRHIMNGGF